MCMSLCVMTIDRPRASVRNVRKLTMTEDAIDRQRYSTVADPGGGGGVAAPL